LLLQLFPNLTTKGCSLFLIITLSAAPHTSLCPPPPTHNKSSVDPAAELLKHR
jgi:hypothetical protein